MEERLEKLQEEILDLKADMVYLMYLTERIDTTLQRQFGTKATDEPSIEQMPFPTEGMRTERF